MLSSTKIRQTIHPSISIMRCCFGSKSILYVSYCTVMYVQYSAGEILIPWAITFVMGKFKNANSRINTAKNGNILYKTDHSRLADWVKSSCHKWKISDSGQLRVSVFTWWFSSHKVDFNFPGLGFQSDLKILLASLALVDLAKEVKFQKN